jgi:hypothetical protein
MNKGKTLTEVKNHCIEVGYNHNARTQICAFLVGAGLKSTQDVLKFKIGAKTFEDFVKWYNAETEELVLERGRFVLIDNDAEVYPALILEAFEDSCLTMSDTGLFCVANEMIVGYADVDDIAHVLESLLDFNLYWDCDKKKLLPFWHCKQKYKV